MKPLKDIWAPIRFSYSGAHGTVHCVFFGPWLKAAYDYPSPMNGTTMAPWREGQPVFATINESHGCEAQA